MLNRVLQLAVSVIALSQGLSCGGFEIQRSAKIRVDGSSTVYPLSEAMAEEFQRRESGVQIAVGVSGTGGGFGKFLRGEVEILNASRPIKASELRLAEEKSVGFIELPVAYDGIAVVVHPSNDWCSSLTVKELKRIWVPAAQGRILRWNQIRPDWPDEPIHLFGPGVDSGTYDYFTLAVVGEEGVSRGDFTSSEDDNLLVWGVARDPNSLGFFGLSYFEDSKGSLKLVAIDDQKSDNGHGPIEPSLVTIFNGSYQPLSRPIFIYVRKEAVDARAVERFVEFYLSNASMLAQELGFIALPSQVYELVMKRFQNRVTGTVFERNGSQVGVTVRELLDLETRS
jgi:phosphate transport system substrate-binding protein